MMARKMLVSMRAVPCLTVVATLAVCAVTIFATDALALSPINPTVGVEAGVRTGKAQMKAKEMRSGTKCTKASISRTRAGVTDLSVGDRYKVKKVNRGYILYGLELGTYSEAQVCSRSADRSVMLGWGYTEGEVDNATESRFHGAKVIEFQQWWQSLSDGDGYKKCFYNVKRLFNRSGSNSMVCFSASWRVGEPQLPRVVVSSAGIVAGELFDAGSPPSNYSLLAYDLSAKSYLPTQLGDFADRPDDLAVTGRRVCWTPKGGQQTCKTVGTG